MNMKNILCSIVPVLLVVLAPSFLDGMSRRDLRGKGFKEPLSNDFSCVEKTAAKDSGNAEKTKKAEKGETITVPDEKGGKSVVYDLAAATASDRKELLACKTRELRLAGRLEEKARVCTVVEEIASLLENGLCNKNVRPIYKFIVLADSIISNLEDSACDRAMHRLVKASLNHAHKTPPIKGGDGSEEHGLSLEWYMKRSLDTFKVDRDNYAVICVKWGGHDEFGSFKKSLAYYQKSGIIGDVSGDKCTPIRLYYYSLGRKIRVSEGSSTKAIERYFNSKEAELGSRKARKSRALFKQIIAEMEWAEKILKARYKDSYSDDVKEALGKKAAI